MTLNPNDVRISQTWANFILFIQREVPFGEVKIKLVGGEPVKLLTKTRDIRFDKVETLPRYSPTVDDIP